MAKSIGFHILFQNGLAKQALERYSETFDNYALDRLDLYQDHGCSLTAQLSNAVNSFTSGKAILIAQPQVGS